MNLSSFLLFGHHEMLETLDILGLDPQTPVEHAVAVALYGAILFAAYRLGTRAAARVGRILAAQRSRAGAARLLRERP